MLLNRSFKATLTALIVAVASLAIAPDALAITKVTLKDGTVLEGDIVREADDFIFLSISVGEVREQRLIRKKDIVEIVRDADPSTGGAGSGEDADAGDGEPMRDTGPVVRRGKKDTPDIPEGATRIAFISLEEMVGPYFNTDALERSVNYLKNMPEGVRPEILVLTIDSGGGALIEQHKIIRYIHEHVKPEFRTVAWIDAAISAACMTAWVIDEVYMMKKAPFGGCTAFRSTASGTEAMVGGPLEEELIWMETVSAWGNKDPFVMRAMQIYATLSADIDEQTGRVTWYLDDSGEHMVSPANEVLTMNSYDAEKFGISQGTADTKNELAKLMGCAEWVEVGQEAEEMMQKFRADVKTAELELVVLVQELEIALQAMNATPELRNKRRHFGRAKDKFQQMRIWAFRRAPSLLLYGQFNEQFFEYMEERLDRIAEQLAD